MIGCNYSKTAHRAPFWPRSKFLHIKAINFDHIELMVITFVSRYVATMKHLQNYQIIILDLVTKPNQKTIKTPINLSIGHHQMTHHMLLMPIWHTWDSCVWNTIKICHQVLLTLHISSRTQLNAECKEKKKIHSYSESMQHPLQCATCIFVCVYWTGILDLIYH